MSQVNGQVDAKTNEALRARIRALLNKTTMNNCTEAEAMSAAAKARELMDKYELDLADLKETEAFTTEPYDWKKARKFDFKAGIAVAVSNYCDCKVWLSTTEKKIKFFGHESDAMFATWLMGALVDFVERGWQDYQLGFLFEEDYACSYEDFLFGASNRIGDRLNLLARERKLNQATGAGLVVKDRRAIVLDAFDRLGMTLYKARSNSFRSRDAASMSAGKSHGDNAAFNRPINGGRKTLMIK